LNKIEQFVHPFSINKETKIKNYVSFEKDLKINGLLWSFGIIIIKYVLGFSNEEIIEIKANILSNEKILKENIKINKIFVIFLENIFLYDNSIFSNIYYM